MKVASRRWLALLSLMAACSANAGTHRLAILVGNNSGEGANATLRFAEADAEKMGRVLGELGGVRREDLYVLRGGSLAQLEETFGRVRHAVVRWHLAGEHALVFFYFSGHSDGQALELGADRLSFVELRRALSGTHADVRLAMVDSCRSGALLAVKGGTLGPTFQIRLTEDVLSEGQVLLTSSAANEVALESREVGGSIFTHHFISGLRGAADASGDGKVTLSEAYQYAFDRTVATSGQTLLGPQHPGYDYSLSGRGDLVLTELDHPRAELEFPTPVERALVLNWRRQQVLAELTRDASPRLALWPGEYFVRVWRQGRPYEVRLTLAEGQHRQVRLAELRPAAGEELPELTKGTGLSAEVESLSTASAWPTLVLSVGGASAVAQDVGWLGAVQLGLRERSPTGWNVSVEGFFRSPGPLTESRWTALVGYHLGWRAGPWTLQLGAEGGGGWAQQSAAGQRFGSAFAAAGPFAGAAIAVSPTVAMELQGHLPWLLLERQASLAVLPAPEAWLGLSWTP